MDEKSCREAIEKERRCISHDILMNKFFYLLSPAWCEDRFGLEDPLYSALIGETKSRKSVLLSLAAWRNECSKEVEKFVKTAGIIYGFVASKRCEKEVKEVLQSIKYIDKFHLPDEGVDDSIAKQIAGEFWSACDSIREFVTRLGRYFGTYFIKWDPSLIKKEHY